MWANIFISPPRTKPLHGIFVHLKYSKKRRNCRLVTACWMWVDPNNDLACEWCTCNSILWTVGCNSACRFLHEASVIWATMAVLYNHYWIWLGGNKLVEIAPQYVAVYRKVLRCRYDNLKHSCKITLHTATPLVRLSITLRSEIWIG